MDTAAKLVEENTRISDRKLTGLHVGTNRQRVWPVSAIKRERVEQGLHSLRRECTEKV
jgi:hypothetical protein